MVLLPLEKGAGGIFPNVFSAKDASLLHRLRPDDVFILGIPAFELDILSPITNL